MESPTQTADKFSHPRASRRSRVYRTRVALVALITFASSLSTAQSKRIRVARYTKDPRPIKLLTVRFKSVGLIVLRIN